MILEKEKSWYHPARRSWTARARKEWRTSFCADIFKGGNMAIDDFLKLPKRPKKQREYGITHVLDKGTSANELEGILDIAADYIDLVKLGWGTGYITKNLPEKIKIYEKYGIPVYFGGTLLELALAQGRFSQYVKMLKKYGIKYVELSNGVIEITQKEKCRLIAQLSGDFTVLSEVGSKDINKIDPPAFWVKYIKSELKAGSWKIITEARESGTTGIFRSTGEIREGLIDEIDMEIPHRKIIFEAPKKPQQVWFIKRFGSNVNLGNIPLEEVIPLETLRLGLRGDTFNISEKKQKKEK
jgi:phosphosulfolactate synthase